MNWTEWREGAGIPPRTPFLLSPSFNYDVGLNSFFLSGDMLCRAWNTQDGYARDLKSFLNFLWHNRNRTSWRDAATADHMAYLAWRRKDPAGPRVDDATWDREVTAVNRFYAWQVSVKNLPDNPIPQRARRPLPPTAGRRGHSEAATTPTTYSHGASREKIKWLPPATYRRWRDVGMRGYTLHGLPGSSFRGRWAARNALFSDVMLRTGLRLAEQTALTLFEMPLDRGLGGYQRFWLPSAIAKGGSAAGLCPGIACRRSHHLCRDRPRRRYRAGASGRPLPALAAPVRGRGSGPANRAQPRRRPAGMRRHARSLSRPMQRLSTL